jgi:hypothetical protein
MRIIHAASGRVGRGVFCAAAATGRLLYVGEVMGPPTSECLLLLSRVPVREDPPFSQRHFRVFLFGLLRPLRRRAAGAPSALCLSRCGAHRAPLHALCAAATAPVPARDYFPCPSASLQGVPPLVLFGHLVGAIRFRCHLFAVHLHLWRARSPAHRRGVHVLW